MGSIAAADGRERRIRTTWFLPLGDTPAAMRVTGSVGTVDQPRRNTPGAQRARGLHAKAAATTADPASASAAPSVVKMAPTTATVPSKAARWVDRRIAIG